MRMFLFVVLLVAATLPWSTSAGAAVLLQDDFSGATLDGSKWTTGTWVLGRTQLANVPVLTDGMAHLRLDTYNPSSTKLFRGTELVSRQTFTRGTGLELEARVRTRAMPAGIVTSFFTYGTRKVKVRTLTDEIDFECLSKEIQTAAGARVDLNTWNDWGDRNATANDGIHNASADPLVAGLDLTAFNTFAIRWLPDRTEWLVNGVLVWATAAALADDPMSIRLNFWVPASSWSTAYDAGLQPATKPAQNVSYEYDVDYVVVRTVAAPVVRTGSSGDAWLDILAVANAVVW